MIYLVTTSDPNIARQIIAANPGTFMVPVAGGQIHIYAGTGPAELRRAKAPPKPPKTAAPKTDYFPWWLAAAALLSIIFALILR